MINNSPTPPTQKWILPAVISVLILATVGGITYVLLKFIDAPRMTVKEAAESSQQRTDTRSLDQLKASAFKKLSEGDQAGAIKEFEQALTLAKEGKDAEQIKYLEQQIDFANTADFPDKQQPAPPRVSSKDAVKLP